MKRHSIVSVLSAIATLATGVTPATAEQNNVYNMLWDLSSGQDSVASISITQANSLNAGRGLVGYIRGWSGPDTTYIHLLNSPAGTDAMVSGTTNEGGYNYVGPLGYVYNNPNAIRGLAKFTRFYNSTNGDHSYNLASSSRAGYTSENWSTYGLPMYGLAPTAYNTLSAGGVTIKSNSMAGGAIFSWVWQGYEFIDVADYGRQMQGAVFYNEGSQAFNPNEAGSKWSAGWTSAAWKKQGSPTYQNFNSGNTQSTRSIPLEWIPENHGGGEAKPVIYDQMLLGKDITLNYNGMGAVAKYETFVTTGSGISNATVELPTAYMPGGTFKRYFTYDAVSQTVTEVFPTDCDSNFKEFQPPSGYGGVIITNTSATLAMGVYGKAVSLGGDVSRYTVYNCGVSKWNAQINGVNLPVGTKKFTTFVMSGTLDYVTGFMRQLYLQGAL